MIGGVNGGNVLGVSEWEKWRSSEEEEQEERGQKSVTRSRDGVAL